MIMHDQEVNPGQVIDEGKTVDDAVEKGLQRLGVTRDQVDIEIIKEGSKGVFSLIGARQAKVILHRKDDTAEVTATLEDMVSNVLDLMGLSSQVVVQAEGDNHRVKIDTAGVDGLLIGKKGQNLIALEHLLRRMVGKQLKRSVRMEVDVGGYKERRIATLRSKAVSIASRVKASNKEMQVEPLSAAERRIVHLAVAEDPDVRTYTVGDGDLKSVVIAPQRRSGRNSTLEGRRV
jgi:spoIIIJ-associated protein